jgi:anti-sigma-K factor RskA
VSRTLPPDERIDELLVDRVLTGLSDADERELRSLLDGDVDDAAFETELAAAAVALAALPMSEISASLPAGVHADVEREAMRFLEDPRTVQARPVGPGPRDMVIAKLNWWGWLAAAAALALAAVGWWPRLSGGAGRMSPERMALQPGAVSIDWAAWAPKPTAEDPESTPVDWSSAVTGRVVWRGDAQQGCMVFRGMRPNDPAKSQYQLWIVDGAQKHPIDAGVFDVATDGETVVPITPKIRVSRPVAFAVTIEPPGGVVVSDQHQRVVVAAAPSSGGRAR